MCKLRLQPWWVPSTLHDLVACLLLHAVRSGKELCILLVSNCCGIVLLLLLLPPWLAGTPAGSSGMFTHSVL